MISDALTDSETMAPVFAGLRVLEVAGGIAGPMAGGVLADNGADVVKVEPLEGDRGRRLPGFRVWNRGKASMALAPSLGLASVEFHELVKRADVVIVEEPSPDLPSLSTTELFAANPDVIHCSVRPFGILGLDSPASQDEGVVVATTGRYLGLDSLSGAHTEVPSESPVLIAPPIASYSAAMLMVQGISGALLARASGAGGTTVETTLLDGLTASIMRVSFRRRGDAVEYATAAQADDPVWKGVELCFMTPECADGRYIQMCARTDRHFLNWLEALGLQHRIADPRFANGPLHIPTAADVRELADEVRDAMRSRTQSEWMDVFTHEYDVGADPVLTAEEFLSHPQMVAGGWVRERTDLEGRPLLEPGPLVKFARTPSQIRGSAPELGQASAVTVAKMWPKTERPFSADKRGSGRVTALPFEGITIVEFAAFLAAPLAPALLRESGARVIKVEPKTGDQYRRIGLEFAHLAHGKESIAIDLKSTQGQEIAQQLVEDADVVVHNFRGDVPERLGIDFARLSAINPDLVYVYASAYGSQGPEARRPGFHSTPHALSGGAYLQAGAGNPPVDDSYADPCSALAVAAAISMGLLARQRDGIGQYVETSMLASTALVHSNLTTIGGGVRPPEVDSAQHGTDALHSLYVCADGWLYIAVGRQWQWEALCLVLDRVEWLTDARFASQTDRAAHDASLRKEIAAAVAEFAVAECVRRLCARQVPAAVANRQRFEEFVVDHGVARAAGHPAFGDYFRLRPRLRYGGTHREDTAPPCSLGEHTRALLAEMGFEAEEIRSLFSEGVVAGG